MASLRNQLRALRGWPLFITLSLLIHLLALLLWYLMTPEPAALSDAPVTPFAVRIETAPQPARAAAMEPPPAQPASTEKSPAPQDKPAVAEAPAPQAKPAIPQEAATPPAISPSAQTPQQSPGAVSRPMDERDLGTSQRLLDTFPDAGGPVTPAPEEKKPDEESRLQIESLIRTRFAEHFVYPRMAQTHGWQGEVLLSFHIALDGTISHIQVVRGSGHDILDQAALDSMRGIERIEFAPGVVLRHTLELRMPVVYHLAQG